MYAAIADVAPSLSTRPVETVFALAILLVFAAALVILVRAGLRASRQRTEDRPSRAVMAWTDEAPRCVSECGQSATEPAPRLARERGSVLRDLFGMPPRYRRVVDRQGPQVYCKSHAHLADGRMAEFVAEQRTALAKAYAQVAHRAAVFEQEELPRMMRESLTDQQRKDARRGGAVSVLPLRKNGTDAPLEG